MRQQYSNKPIPLPSRPSPAVYIGEGSGSRDEGIAVERTHHSHGLHERDGVESREERRRRKEAARKERKHKLKRSSSREVSIDRASTDGGSFPSDMDGQYRESRRAQKRARRYGSPPEVSQFEPPSTRQPPVNPGHMWEPQREGHPYHPYHGEAPPPPHYREPYADPQMHGQPVLPPQQMWGPPSYSGVQQMYYNPPEPQQFASIGGPAPTAPYYPRNATQVTAPPVGHNVPKATPTTTVALQNSAEALTSRERAELDKNAIPPSNPMSSNPDRVPGMNRTTTLIPDEVLLQHCQDWVSADELKAKLQPPYSQHNKKKILKMLRELRDDGIVDMSQPWGHKPPYFRARLRTTLPTPDDIPPEVIVSCCEGGATAHNVLAKMPPQYREFPIETVREKLDSLVGRYLEVAFPAGSKQAVYYPKMASQRLQIEDGEQQNSGGQFPQLEDGNVEGDDGMQVVTYEDTQSSSVASNSAADAVHTDVQASNGNSRNPLPYMETNQDGQSEQFRKAVESIARPGACQSKNLVIMDLDNCSHGIDTYHAVKLQNPDDWEIVSVCGAAYQGNALGTVFRCKEAIKDEADSWAAYILFSRAGRRELKDRVIHLVSRDSVFRSFKCVLDSLPEDQRPEKVYHVPNP